MLSRPHAARFIAAILCATLNVLVPSHALKSTNPEVQMASTHLTAVAKAISNSPQSLHHYPSPTFDHLTCVLLALSRLSELDMHAHHAPMELADSTPATNGSAATDIGSKLPDCTSSTARTVLDAIELQVFGALKEKPEVQKQVFQSSCIALGSSQDMLVPNAAKGSNDVRSQLRGILMAVAKHASINMHGGGAQKSNGAVQAGENWGWNCGVLRAVSARHVSRAGDSTEAGMLLCEQLSKALALCSVTGRCVPALIYCL